MTEDKIKVEVLGRTFELDSEHLTPIEANAIAQFVSERMNEIQKQSNVVDTSRLATMVALNLADQLMHMQSKQEKLTKDFRNRTRNMIHLIEESLK